MGTTANYSWVYPTVNADADAWGTILNTMAIAIDASLKTVDDKTAAAALKANNLSDLANAGTARTNLGLGSSATKNIQNSFYSSMPALASVTTVAGNIAGFADTSGSIGDTGIGQTDLLTKSGNLASLASASTSRTNLGLGSIATRTYSSGTAAPSGGSNGDLYGQYA